MASRKLSWSAFFCGFSAMYFLTWSCQWSMRRLCFAIFDGLSWVQLGCDGRRPCRHVSTFVSTWFQLEVSSLTAGRRTTDGDSALSCRTCLLTVLTSHEWRCDFPSLVLGMIPVVAFIAAWHRRTQGIVPSRFIGSSTQEQSAIARWAFAIACQFLVCRATSSNTQNTFHDHLTFGLFIY